MNGLREGIEKYLELRRSLGFDLRVQAGILRRFANFAEGEDSSYVTTGLVLRWADTLSHALPATVARSVNVVRRFAIWQAALDSRTEVPPTRLVASRYERRRPFLHTDEQIVQLLLETEQMQSPKGLRGPTFSVLFGLIAVTGLRISEALKLDRSDVNLIDGVLVIRRTKFGKSRLVPVHPTTRTALAMYAELRNRILGDITTPAFFVSEKAQRISGCAARHYFAHVSRLVGQRASAGKGLTGRRRVRMKTRRGHGPRLHDLRHRFAAHTLLNWYRDGVDVERELPKLSTYLGHCTVSQTYWYIDAVPELLQLAAGRIALPRREVVR
jgi:integrase/recombinase XerD